MLRQLARHRAGARYNGATGEIHREHIPRADLFWKYSVVLVLVAVIPAALWLAVASWKRGTSDFESERFSESYPMQLSPRIAGNDKARVGELVYSTRVLLKPGPTPKMFFLVGSQGTQILTVADAAHVVATPGQMVDVSGTIRNTPPVSILRKQWKLSHADAIRVSQVPIYIESSFIRESGD